MIRGTWKPRDNNKGQENKTEEKENMEIDPDSENEDEEDEEDEEEEEEDEDEAEEEEDLDEGNEGEETPKARYNDGSNTRSPAVSPKPPSPRQSSRFGLDEAEKVEGFMHPELHNPQVLRGNFGPRGRGRARIAANVRPHTVHARGGGIVSDAPAKRGGYTRGFPPRGTARGGVMQVQGGVKGRGNE
ncbi:hypothetical protein J3R82DRAFT_2640 [Butyriboletus roseoflavus]|nr:hypothetical protein J3R82DRAFT_2640 [Butyriboletus roseoflavus]